MFVKILQLSHLLLNKKLIILMLLYYAFIFNYKLINDCCDTEKQEILELIRFKLLPTLIKLSKDYH